MGRVQFIGGSPYVQNGKIGSLVSINDQVSKHLTQLCLLKSLADDQGSQDRTSYVDSVIDGAINSLSSKKDTLNNQLDRMVSLSKEQSSRLEFLSEEIEQKQNELTKLSSDWQSQFSSAQESRIQEFSKWRDDFASEKSKEVQGIIHDYTGILEEQASKFKNEIGLLIEDSKSKHQSILDLYELTAGDSVGAAYIKSAGEEKEQADNWRIVSVSFIALTVVWLIFSYFYNTEDIEQAAAAGMEVAQREAGSQDSSEDPLESISPGVNSSQQHHFSWHTMLIAFSISGVLLWGAAYSAQQSTRHRNYEKRARWFALEVKAFDPFISSLKPEQQQDLKKQLAERIFGQNSTNDNDDSKIVDEHALKAVTDAIGRVLSKLPK